MRESPSTWHPDVVNRFVFRDITDIHTYGLVSDVSVFNGIATFNGSSSKIEFNSVYHSNVYSIRLKINSLDSLTQDICKLSSTMGVSINSGTIVATGFSTPRIYINGKLSYTITSTGGDIFIVQDTPFVINSFVLGYNTSYFSGSIDLVEFYNEPLVEGMCDAIYTGRYFKEHPADMHLIKQMKKKGYIWVPGNSLYPGCEKGFWVAKYEMKASKTGVNGRGLNVADFPAMTGTYNTWYYEEDSNITIVSTPEGSPIANITQTEAISACQAIGGHLITNNEWMTIARNIEQVPSNWSTGTVGQGYIYSGHNNNAPAGALEASIDTNGYAGTGQTSGNQRRTLTLTNGEVIWDLAGNVWQWTSDTIQRKDQPDGFNNADDSNFTTGWEWFDYSKGGGVTQYISSDNLGNTTLEYKDLFLLTSNSYNATNGVGRIYTYSAVGDTSTTVYSFLRGGRWNYGANAGVLGLNLSNTPGLRYYNIGLRCVQ